MKQCKMLLASLAVAALVLPISSCTTMVNVESVRPPVVKVQPDQWKVLVVNRFDAKSQAADQNSNVIEVLREGAYQAVGGAMGAIFNDSTFVLLNIDEAVNLSPTTASLSQEEVRSLFTQYRPHLILTLDKFDARFSKKVANYVDEDGFRTKAAAYDLIVSSNWALYDSTGAQLDRSTVQQADFYDARAVVSGLLAIGPAMGKAAPIVNRLAVETGYSYWDRFYPQGQLLVREVHLASKLNNATMQLLAGQFEQAINVLLPIAQDPKNKRSTKAAHNLAIAYEAVGNQEQATYWAQQAKSKGDKLASTLLDLWSQAGTLQ